MHYALFCSSCKVAARRTPSHAVKGRPRNGKLPAEKITFVIRLLPQVSESLRARARTHGDLSRTIETAIKDADLERMNLVPLGGRPPRSGEVREKVVKATTVSLRVPTYDAIGRAAQTRRKSKNVIINSALLWWLERTPSSRAKRESLALDDTEAARAILTPPTPSKQSGVTEAWDVPYRASLASLLARAPAQRDTRLQVLYADIVAVLAVGHSLRDACDALGQHELMITPVQLGAFLAKERTRRSRLASPAG